MRYIPAIARAATPTIQMPTKLKMNEMPMSQLRFIFAKLKMLMPISSGNGDAMTRPATMSESQRNERILRSATSLHHQLRLRMVHTFGWICSSMCFFTKWNMMRSPSIAPHAPKNAMTGSGWMSDSSPSMTMAIAVENADVKSAPPMSPAMMPNGEMVVRMPMSVPVFTSMYATKMLVMMSPMSCGTPVGFIDLTDFDLGMLLTL